MPRIPDDAPELTAREANQVDEKAKAAAIAAQARKAMEFLPFNDLPLAQRLVATWLRSIPELFNFFDSQVKGGNSVQVYRVARGSEVSVGMCHGRSHEDFIRQLTRLFCGNRETDEIHELIAIKWIVRIATRRPEAYVEPRGWRNRRRSDPGEYVNAAQRGSKRETAELIAIRVVEEVGGKAARKIKEVYDEVHARVWEIEENNIRADRRRNQRLLNAAARKDARQEARAERRKK